MPDYTRNQVRVLINAYSANVEWHDPDYDYLIWSALAKRGLAQTNGLTKRRKRYTLTDEGHKVARQLQDIEDRRNREAKERAEREAKTRADLERRFPSGSIG